MGTRCFGYSCPVSTACAQRERSSHMSRSASRPIPGRTPHLARMSARWCNVYLSSIVTTGGFAATVAGAGACDGCSELAGEPGLAFLRGDLSLVCYGGEHMPWVSTHGEVNGYLGVLTGTPGPPCLGHAVGAHITYLFVYIDICIHTLIFTHPHTYIYTHTHMHTHARAPRHCN